LPYEFGPPSIQVRALLLFGRLWTIIAMLKRLLGMLVGVRENLRSDVVLFYLTYVSRRTSSGEASELGGTPEQAI